MTVGTVSITQRILDRIGSESITYSALRHALVQRGGDIGAESFALAVGDLIDARMIRARGGVITRWEAHSAG